MLDQYNRETSQIYAPAALIQKTKDAMRAEEERLLAEKTPQANSSADQCVAGIGKDCKTIAVKRRSSFFYGGLRRWTLPLTAAAALVIVVSVSAAMRVVKSGGASSDMAAGDGYINESAEWSETAAEDKSDAGAADMTEASAGALEDEALPAEEMPEAGVEAEAPAEEMLDASAEAEAPAEEMPDASVETQAPAGAASGGVTEASESDMTAASDKAESDDSLAMKGNEGAQTSEDARGDESGIENSVMKPDEELTITKVEKKPSVYNSSEAERIPYQEVIFYVVSGEDGEYSAYARVNRSRYVISGKAADREEFLEKAYELLTEESFY